MKKVVASLKYGYLYNNVLKSILIVCDVFFIAVLVSMIGCNASGLFGSLSVFEIVLCFLFGAFAGIVCPILSVFVLIRDKNRKKEIELWSEDFVEIGAKVSRLPVDKIINKNPYNLKIKFMIDGVEYVKISEYGNSVLDNSALMLELVGENVPIYYSAKYDQVVFIAKPKKNGKNQ